MREGEPLRVAIIGGGPAGLIAAFILAQHASVDLYEQGRNVGRKFLVAGDGGLNITNSAGGETLFEHYAPAYPMKAMLEAFGPAALREWLASIGVPTFVGTSGRVFPEQGIKPAEVLKAITEVLKSNGVRIHAEHHFVGFDEDAKPIIAYGDDRSTVHADAYLFALGGASWPKTGSTGEWSVAFRSIDVQVNEFQASNCGVMTHMPEGLLPHVGKPLKNIAVTSGAKTLRGELTITEYGLEGNAIYPIIPQVREQLAASGEALVSIDLKPDLSEERINEKLRDAAWKERLAVLNLDRPSVSLLKAFTAVDRYLDGRTLAHDVKNVIVPIHALRSIEEAISTVGGIAMDEMNENLSLKKQPHIFVAGEMLDWDAPTGGFLLQGAFSTGHWAAQRILERLGLSEQV
ncbi:MAG: TIGR03862 family flavoprotein [Flavobacteriales bacterium]|nr:TIGR03862 family flavoprotein [Flavobacteriales bacterium]